MVTCAALSVSEGTNVTAVAPEPITTTFPDTTTTAAWTTNAVPTAAGSVFMNAYGTATRSTLTAAPGAHEQVLEILSSLGAPEDYR